MHVTELNEDELFQLKESLYFGDDCVPDVTKEQADLINNTTYIEDIPDSIVFEIYDGIDFVEDDFWCNAK